MRARPADAAVNLFKALVPTAPDDLRESVRTLKVHDHVVDGSRLVRGTEQRPGAHDRRGATARRSLLDTADMAAADIAPGDRRGGAW